MMNDPRLERYLTSLESALKPFPVSDRAEIITEIKSHVLSALERDPQTHLDSVLGALGEPETVANRYLLERGLKPTKPPISPIVKWLVIGFLGTFAMVLVFAGFVLSRFTSIVKVDEENDRVEVLGGLIDIDGKKNNISIRGVTNGGTPFAGSSELQQGQAVNVKFNSGKFAVENTLDPAFLWDCKVKGSATPPTAVDGVLSFDLSDLRSANCVLKFPKNSKVMIEGQNGKLEFEEPRFDIDAKLANGKAEFSAASDALYQFDMSVGAGHTDKFESSNDPTAHKIRVHVDNGKIQKEEAEEKEVEDGNE